MTTLPHISRHRILYAIGALAVLALVLALLPIRIPMSATVFGRLLPAREWVLLRTDNGQLTSLVRSNGTGVVEQYSVTQPERGDAMHFVLSPAVLTAASVQEGDTIGWVTSPELAQQLAALEGALDVAHAAEASARSGDKPAVVQQSHGALAQARAAFDEQQHLHARQAEPHQKKILSDEEFELSRDRLEVLRAGVAVAEAQLAAATSGRKPEDVRQMEAQAAALEDEIAAVRLRMNRFTHIAPLSGVLLHPQAADTLMAVQDQSALVLMLPVDIGDCTGLREGDRIAFDIPLTGLSGTAILLRIDRAVQYVKGRPVCVVSAEIRDGAEDLRPGLIARCRVETPPLSVSGYLLHLWSRITM
ncbi:MAG: hypothetical protein IH600_04715 [Bacteroidetes bacterium]|nr:hypothetical protein [Bacteroidota bacterium]